MYRAVIVDDEPFMLEGMRIMIDWKRCGFTLCGEAGTAQDALHLMDTLQPHLLITDVRMPGMLGTDLASIVSRYHPNVLILFFSGYRDFDYVQSAIRSHAFGYLIKPIDTEEVEATLMRAKAELDARQDSTRQKAHQTPVLRDQVFGHIASGDDSTESLLRVSVLMELETEDPCYCAVLTHHHGAIPENARFVLASCHAVLFELSPKEYGLAFRQIERDIPLLKQLKVLLADQETFTLSAGGVYYGPRGFRKSLLEALDAQGVLYETDGALRLYKPYDAQTAAWYSHACLLALRDALAHGNSHALEAGITALSKAASRTKPSLFALRCMASALDAMLPIAINDLRPSLNHPLWHQEAAEWDAWLAAFCNQLRAIQRTMMPETEKALPEPVQATVAAIRTRYHEPLNLSRIAGDLHINPAYLGQLVRKHTGATFHRQLLVTRIEHACLLLRQTMNPINEVAVQIGFRDVDYFSQQFRTRMGMSPVAYRNAVASKEDLHAPH